MFKYILLSLIFILVLTLRYYLFFQNRLQIPDGSRIHFQARLLHEPKRTDRFQILQFYLSGNTFFARVPLYPAFQYGQTLGVLGRTKGIKGEQYKHYLLQPEISLAEKQGIVFPLITALQEHIKTVFRKNLSPSASSLLLGVVFGIREGMPKDFLSDLQATGMLHVIAASGMNVSFVAGAVLVLLRPFFRRQVAIVLACILVWLYAVLAGFEASIMRAAAMGTVAFMAGLFGRQYIGLFSLIFIGLLMLLWQPEMLFDIGFQLSFLATAGIIVATQVFPQAHGSMAAFKTDLMTTLAAQLATLPTILSTFGSYSLLSVLVNLLVVWTVPPLMILGSLAGVLGLLLEKLAVPIFWLSLPFLLYFEAVVSFFGKIPLSMKVSNLHWTVVVGYYLVLLAFIVLRIKKQE